MVCWCEGNNCNFGSNSIDSNLILLIVIVINVLIYNLGWTSPEKISHKWISTNALFSKLFCPKIVWCHLLSDCTHYKYDAIDWFLNSSEINFQIIHEL
jgi:hypothetical protein